MGDEVEKYLGVGIFWGGVAKIMLKCGVAKKSLGKVAKKLGWGGNILGAE